MALKFSSFSFRITCLFVYLDLVTGVSLKFLQFKAVFIKRFLCALRDKKSVITQFLLPIVFVLLGLILIKTSSEETDDKPRLLNLMNISLVAPSGSANIYYADLRSAGGGDNLFQVSYVLLMISTYMTNLFAM